MTCLPARSPRHSLLAIRDRYLAPSLLAPFADEMARRLSRLSIGPLLETSADTGVLTQAIASAVSAGLTIIATDPSAEMVEHASAKPGMARVTWQQADPRALPFPDATFGIVTCHFGVVAHARPRSGISGGSARNETGRPFRLQRAGAHSGTTRSPTACKTPWTRCSPPTRRGSWSTSCMVTPTTKRSMTT